jgi:heat shock protein 4
MDVDGANPAAEGEAPPQPKKKRIVKKKEVPFVSGASSLDPSIVEKFKEEEGQMHASDKLVMDTENCKNALEEYVYDMRGKLDDRYAAYVQPQEKEKLLAILSEKENWLYTEEGEDATKSAYISHLNDAKALGDPIVHRYRENEERPRFVSSLRETLNKYMADATSGDEKYSHIDEKDKQSVIEKVATVQKWLEDQIARQAERPKNVDPVLLNKDVEKKREEVIFFATPIMSKPKPKVTTTTSQTGTPGNQTPNRTATPNPAEDKDKDKPEGDQQEMDVD